jgi:Trk K+ transport system NAD-binding subunit
MVLVCGLGSLGQACLLRLLPFDVQLGGIDVRPPRWRDPRLEERFGSDVVLGDMRLPHVLRQAGVEKARAVLLLSSESTVNFEAALQVRLINPSVEVVVRSSGRLASLGALLEERLPGVAVVDPLILTAGAITEALRPGDQVACFRVDGQSYVVLEGKAEDFRLQRPLRLGTGGEERPLLVTPMGLHLPRSIGLQEASPTAGGFGEALRPPRAVLHWWRQRTSLQRGQLLALLALVAAGFVLFSRSGGWKQGVFVTLAFLLGEYVDPVNVLLPQATGIAGAEPWLIGVTLIYSLIGTLLTSALVAVILEWLLRERFGLGRPAHPRRGSRRILIADGEELGVQVARALEHDRHRVVRIDSRPDRPRTEPGMAAFERWEPALAALRHCRVDGIGLLSSDLLANLQEALHLQRRWATARVVILAHAVEAAEQLGELLGGVTVISSMDLVADAVVATALGERVEEICRIDGVNLLLVRYRISSGDSLHGLSMARVENGFGVTAVQLLRHGRAAPLVLPSLDLVLIEGDQLLVLATLAALRRIELGLQAAPAWRVRLQGAPQSDRRFDAMQCLARHLGMPPGAMAALLDGGEHLTPGLDREIAERLVEELRRQGVDARLEPAGEPALSDDLPWSHRGDDFRDGP